MDSFLLFFFIPLVFMKRFSFSFDPKKQSTMMIELRGPPLEDMLYFKIWYKTEACVKHLIKACGTLLSILQIKYNNSFNKLVWLLVCLRMLEGTDSLNVALGARGMICDRDESHKILDGDLRSKIVIYQGRCKMALLDNEDTIRYFIILKESYIIQYVVHYSARHKDRTGVNLKFLTQVELNEGPWTVFCGMNLEWASRQSLLRINCQPYQMAFDRVHFKIETDINFMTRDIEVHILADRHPKIKHALIHRGCFDGFVEEPETLSWENCYTKCFKNGYVFAGIKDRKYCGCKNNINPFGELPVEECNLLCEDGVGACGSKDAFSVYIVNVPLPHHRGCFVAENIITYKNSLLISVTPQRCLIHCNNYNFALLQIGNSCYCQNIDDNKYLSQSMVDPNNCNVRCEGNSTLSCGGANHVAVYSTCKFEEADHITCSELFLCASMYSYDVNGECRDFGYGDDPWEHIVIIPCRRGYTGVHCMERINGSSKYIPLTTESHNISRIEITLFDRMLYFLRKNMIMLIVAPTFLLMIVLIINLCFWTKSPACRQNREPLDVDLRLWRCELRVNVRQDGEQPRSDLKKRGDLIVDAMVDSQPVNLERSGDTLSYFLLLKMSLAAVLMILCSCSRR